VHNVLAGDLRLPPFTDKVHDSRDKTAVHQHPGAVPFWVTPDLEDVKSLHGERCGKVRRGRGFANPTLSIQGDLFHHHPVGGQFILDFLMLNKKKLRYSCAAPVF
jgi:hypothetical protein